MWTRRQRQMCIRDRAEGMGLEIVKSNHDIYSNRNAPTDAINIQTFYEKKFSDKKITYMCFKIK